MTHPSGVRTFGDMNREQNVLRYYFQCHVAAAGRTWQQMCQSNADTLPVTLKVVDDSAMTRP